MNEDQAKGAMQKAKVIVKEVVNNLLANESLQAQGRAQQVLGAVQKKVGNVRHAVDTIAKKPWHGCHGLVLLNANCPLKSGKFAFHIVYFNVRTGLFFKTPLIAQMACVNSSRAKRLPSLRRLGTGAEGTPQPPSVKMRTWHLPHQGL